MSVFLLLEGCKGALVLENFQLFPKEEISFYQIHEEELEVIKKYIESSTEIK